MNKIPDHLPRTEPKNLISLDEESVDRDKNEIVKTPPQGVYSESRSETDFDMQQSLARIPGADFKFGLKMAASPTKSDKGDDLDK